MPPAGYTSPSSMIMLSDETSILGNSSASLSAKAQWVVARRPLMSPRFSENERAGTDRADSHTERMLDESHFDAGRILCIFSGMTMLGGAMM